MREVPPLLELRNYKRVAEHYRSVEFGPKQRFWGMSAISPLSEDRQTTGEWAKNDASDP
jgi:hypothetical protein